MKQLHHTVFKTSSWSLGLFFMAVLSIQAQTKTYKESFKVNPETVIDINTSHADLEFETWDKQEVLVEATIELEGASEEESTTYFEKNGINILGNSQKIQIRTEMGAPMAMSYNFTTGPKAHIAMEMHPQMELLFHDLEIPDLPPMPEMPPMPPMPKENFDYEAFKKDGEKYMKKWQKEFRKGFDAKYEKELEAWSESMADRMEVYAERMEKRAEMREKLSEEREQRREEMEAVRAEARKEMEAARAEMRDEMEAARGYAREAARKALDEARVTRKNVIIHRDGNSDAPNVFYYSGEGEHKKFKIKKTIRVKMPKDLKIKMNVKHGEVKLASQTINLDANLSYASLQARTIDGSATNIHVAYSPVAVKLWKIGSLKTDFAGDVVLNEVHNLDLRANSSDVSIKSLLKTATIVNSLGSMNIGRISEGFDKVEINMQNGELKCSLPASAYKFTIEGSSNELSLPIFMTKARQNESGGFQKFQGFHLDKSSSKSLVIRTNYSDVNLQ
ncbi:hypothetical protein [Zeaxanthinibacter enoshimensis]|uniref:hypothetical protein n=1 Tax=Zeaxanthinibacter enoshimensis TaxID=392009 RepID=UPI0035621168